MFKIFSRWQRRDQYAQWHSHWGVKVGQSAPPSSEKFAKNQGKEGENQKKLGKRGKIRKKRQGSFTLPLLADRAGYATEYAMCTLSICCVNVGHLFDRCYVYVGYSQWQSSRWVGCLDKKWTKKQLCQILRTKKLVQIRHKLALYLQ